MHPRCFGDYDRAITLYTHPSGQFRALATLHIGRFPVRATFGPDGATVAVAFDDTGPELRDG